MVPVYIPGNSSLHRLHPGLKLAALAVLGTLSVLTSEPWLLLVGFALVGAGFVVARLPLLSIADALRPALLMIAFFALLQAVYVGPVASAVTALRFAILILAAALVTYTTPFSDMLAVLTGLMLPLRYIGLSPSKAGLALALTLRFIPVLMSDFEEIQQARVARGASRYGIGVVGSLLLVTINKAQAIGDAIAARGFEEREGGVIR
jgi:biotin transport system permease protein